jgi:hypothetical protein
VKDKGYQLLSAGKYLTALNKLQAEYISPQETPLTHNFLLWALNSLDPWGSAWELSGAGQEGFELTEPNALLEPEGVLIKAMAEHRVVILMEAHRWPETRYYGARLLQVLKVAGATHLAFETSLQSTLDQFEKSGTVLPNSEAYAFDPARAELLRNARRLGLKIIAFDFPPNNNLAVSLSQLFRPGKAPATPTNEARERYMAENIVNLIFKRDPGAKVVVWTGEQHAMKHTPSWWPDQHPFMAAHLAELSGEEPYCVYQQCVNLPQLNGSPKLINGDHPQFREYGVDAVILHQRGSQPTRPEWLNPGTQEISVPTQEAVLVQAIPVEEGPKAVPVAQWLTNGAASLQVRIKHGAYILKGLDSNDRVIWQKG